MKISAVDTGILRVPCTQPVGKHFPYHTFVRADIRTDAGLEGLGYTCMFSGQGGEAVLSYLDTRLKDLLIGRDPQHVTALNREMYLRDGGIRSQGIVGYAMSCLDIGLWDLCGKIAGQPLYRLWGACREHVPAYGSGGWRSYAVDDLVAEALKFKARGAAHYKLKIHCDDPRENYERVREVREAVGPDMALMVDVNGRLDVLGNIRQADMLEELDIFWYEEPVHADETSQCAEVAARINIPVATGENEYFLSGFRDLIEARAAYYLMPDLQRCGGFTQGLRIAALAEAHGLPITPHLAHEISLQLLGSVPNGLFAEYVDWHPENLFEHAPVLEGGRFAIPQRPGHGVAFTAEARRDYRVG